MTEWLQWFQHHCKLHQSSPLASKQEFLSGALCVLAVILRGVVWRLNSPHGKFVSPGPRSSKIIRGWNAQCRSALLAQSAARTYMYHLRDSSDKRTLNNFLLAFEQIFYTRNKMCSRPMICTMSPIWGACFFPYARFTRRLGSETKVLSRIIL